MSILIKGMEMPVIELEWTIRRGADGKWYAIDTNAETSDGEWHEIVPVPPHGRLIDADAFLALINDSTILSDFLKCIINPLIRGEPTIIPKSGGTEDE